MTLDERLDAARREYADRSWDPPAVDVPTARPVLAPRRFPPRLAAVAAAVAFLIIGTGWLVVARDRPHDLQVTATTVPVSVPVPGTVDPRAADPGGYGWARGTYLDGTISASVASSDRLYLAYRDFGGLQPVSTGGVVVVDLLTGTRLADHKLPGAIGPGGMAIAGGKVWFTTTGDTNPGATALYALAPDDGATPQRIDDVDAGTTVAGSRDRLWVRRWTETQERDPSDGHVIASTPAASAGAIATDGTTTWTTTTADSTVTRIAPSGSPGAVALDPAAGKVGAVHVADGIVYIVQGQGITLVDADRGQVIATLPLSRDSLRPLVSTDLRGDVLWVVTFSGRVLALNMATGARHVIERDGNWAEGPLTVTALSDRTAVICYGTDTVQSFCRRRSIDGSTPTDPSSSEPAFHAVALGPEQLQTFRARVTAADVIIDRFVPASIDAVAATTSVVGSGHVIGVAGPRTAPFVVAPDQASLPNGDIVADQLVLLVRVNRVDRRPGTTSTLTAGDVIALPWTIGLGARDQSAARLPAVQEAIDAAPIGARITIPFETAEPGAAAAVVDGLRLGGRPFLALTDGTHVTPLETSLDNVVASRTLDEVTDELIERVQARR